MEVSSQNVVGQGKSLPSDGLHVMIHYRKGCGLEGENVLFWFDWNLGEEVEVGTQQASKWLVVSFLGRELKLEVSPGVFSAEHSQ